MLSCPCIVPRSALPALPFCQLDPCLHAVRDHVPTYSRRHWGGESLPLARPDAPGVDRVALKRIASLATGDKIKDDVPTLRDKVDGYARYNRSQRRAWECWSGVPRAPDALGRPGRDSAPRPVTPRRNPPV